MAGTPQRARRTSEPGRTGGSTEALHRAMALHRAGDLRAARRLYGRILATAPGNIDALHLLGSIELQEGRPERAVPLLRRALTINGRVALLHSKLGNAYRALGRTAEAEQALLRAIELDADDAQSQFDLGELYLQQERLREALARFARVDALHPDHPPTLHHIGHTLMALGEYALAVDTARRILAIEPGNAAAHFNLGISLQHAYRYAEAAQAFERALRLQPDDAQARAKLADALEYLGRIEPARAAAQQALAAEPDNPTALLVLSRIDRRAGDHPAVVARLRPLLDGAPHTDADASLFTELGLALDRTGDTDAAFAAFEQANRISRDGPLAKLIDTQADRAQIAGSRDALGAARLADWPRQHPDGLPAPVFLIGFPRSGTTLTEQILAAHRNIITGDELPALSQLALQPERVLGRRIDLLQGLDALGAEDIGRLRARYWEMITERSGPQALQRRFVDKFPLNIVRLGLIRRIFPEAKLIVALRDPRDVCLSCFMQDFALNAAMVNFLDLHHTARYYAQVMGLWLQYRDTLDLDFLELRYEDTVADLDASARRLLEFLGESWDEGVTRYFEAAARRGISTPSYQDVAQPVYARARGRWQRYDQHLQPIYPILAPYIEAFGYGAPDGR